MTDEELLEAAARAAGIELDPGTTRITGTMQIALPITEVRQFSEYGQFAVGDYVTRRGSDVHIVESMEDDGYCATFVCVVAPESGWCAVGDDEFNLCSRYSRVDYEPNAEITGLPGLLPAIGLE